MTRRGEYGWTARDPRDDPRQTLAPSPTWPRRGNLVRLNARGLAAVHGLCTPEELMAQRDGFRVVRTEPIDCDPPAVAVDVDGPLGLFLLTGDDLEPA